jgi:hypothetical protein
LIIVAAAVVDYLNVMRNLSAGHDYLLMGLKISFVYSAGRIHVFNSPNKLFDSAKLLGRWFTFLRLRVDGETEPSREPETSASKSVRGGLLFSIVKPEACD